MLQAQALSSEELELLRSMRDGSDIWGDPLERRIADLLTRTVIEWAENGGSFAAWDEKELHAIFLQFIRDRRDDAQESLDDPHQLRLGDDEEGWRETVRTAEALLARIGPTS